MCDREDKIKDIDAQQHRDSLHWDDVFSLQHVDASPTEIRYSNKNDKITSCQQ